MDEEAVKGVLKPTFAESWVFIYLVCLILIERSQVQLEEYVTPVHNTFIHFSIPGWYFPHVRSDSGEIMHRSFVSVDTQDDFFR